MAPMADVVIVVGSPNSSNSNRLREVAANRGVPAYMIDRADELQPEWLAGKARIGVTAGASAPEVLVKEVLSRLAELGRSEVRELDGTLESIVFPMPKGLHTLATAPAPEVGPDPATPCQPAPQLTGSEVVDLEARALFDRAW